MIKKSWAKQLCVAVRSPDARVCAIHSEKSEIVLSRTSAYNSCILVRRTAHSLQRCKKASVLVGIPIYNYIWPFERHSVVEDWVCGSAGDSGIESGP